MDSLESDLLYRLRDEENIDESEVRTLPDDYSMRGSIASTARPSEDRRHNMRFNEDRYAAQRLEQANLGNGPDLDAGQIDSNFLFTPRRHH